MRFKSWSPTGLGIVTVLVAAVVSPGHADPVLLPAESRLLERAGPRAVAVTDPVTGTIVALRCLDVPIPRGESIPTWVHGWLLEHADAFGLDPARDVLELERDEPRQGGGRRLLFRQVAHDIPVWGGDVRCVLDGTGRLQSAAGSFVPDLAEPRPPGVDRAGAIGRAATAVGARLDREPAEARLWWRRREGVVRLEWQVSVPLEDGHSTSRWVDAASGETLAPDDFTARAAGLGLVFPTDPRGPEAEVPLPRLSRIDRLANRLVGIADLFIPPVTGVAGDFRYPSSSLQFDQVNAFWHSDRFLNDFLGSLGYAGPPESLIVRVHDDLEPRVAQTEGRLVSLGRAFSDLSGDVSRCHDIVYHELTHAVLFGFGVQLGGDKRQALALHEGVADYLAAACTEDPAIGEWLYRSFPLGATRVDQPVPPWQMSNYDKLSWGLAPIGSQWANGMILASALWDLRTLAGRTADSLVLEAMDHLPTLPEWGHLVNGLLQADAERHGDRAFPAIVQAMTRRGIRGSAAAAFTGPTALAPGEPGEWSAIPCCGPASGAFRWRVREWCRGRPCGDWRPLGQGLVLRTSLQEDSEVGLEVYASWGDTLRASRFVSVRPPFLVVEGPRRVAQNAQGTWRARVAAMGPWRVSWERRWRRPSEPRVFLGTGTEVTFAAETAFDLDVTLRATLKDATQVVTTRVSVETFVDRPPADPARRLAVSVRLDAGANGAEVRFESSRTEAVKLELIDVRGRMRGHPWNGPSPQGGHVVHWDVSGLEPGVYFLRAQNPYESAIARFIVLR